MQANQQFTEMDLALPREWRLSDTGSKTILPRREPFLPPSPSERPQEEHSWSSWVYNERLVAGDFAMTSSGIGPQDVNTDAEFVKGFTDERILSVKLTFVVGAELGDGHFRKSFKLHGSFVRRDAQGLAKMWDPTTNSPINLPKEDPGDFAIVLDYLVGRRLEAGDNSSVDRPKKLIDLYVLAEKLEITRLMENIVVQLYQCPKFTEDPQWFFCLAQRVWNETKHGSNTVFRTFFRSKGPMVKEKVVSYHQKKFMENLVKGGGEFADEVDNL